MSGTIDRRACLVRVQYSGNRTSVLVSLNPTRYRSGDPLRDVYAQQPRPETNIIPMRSSVLASKHRARVPLINAVRNVVSFGWGPSVGDIPANQLPLPRERW